MGKKIALLFFWNLLLTLTRPSRKKLRMRWFFDVSKVKESSFFFKSDLTAPPHIFDAHLFENIDLSPSRFHFSFGFISTSYFEKNNDVCSHYQTFNHIILNKKRYVYFAELVMSQRWSGIFCATGAWGFNQNSLLWHVTCITSFSLVRRINFDIYFYGLIWV